MRRIAIRMLSIPSVVVLALMLSGCSSSSVEIRSAVASQDDTRVEVALTSCNADLVVDVTEDDEEVIVSVSDADAPLLRTGGDACDDHYVVQFERPLGGRDLVDGTTGQIVPILRPPPDSRPPYPYDRVRVTETDYLEALDAMVSCLEALDPELDAWVHQALDWATYRWHKEPDNQGNLARPPALDICHEKHLQALEPPSNP